MAIYSPQRDSSKNQEISKKRVYVFKPAGKSTYVYNITSKESELLTNQTELRAFLNNNSVNLSTYSTDSEAYYLLTYIRGTNISKQFKIKLLYVTQYHNLSI